LFTVVATPYQWRRRRTHHPAHHNARDGTRRARRDIGARLGLKALCLKALGLKAVTKIVNRKREIWVMRAAILLAGAALFFLTQRTATAAVWVFGDSNVDAGAFTVAPYSGSSAYDALLMNAASLGIGRQTNGPGRMSIEVLAAMFHTEAEPASRGGTNFATSGAKNVEVNTPSNGGFPNAVPTVRQIGAFIQKHIEPGEDGIIVIDSGANDISYALNDIADPTAQNAYIQNQAVQLAKAIHELLCCKDWHAIVTDQPESFGTAQQMAARHLYNTTLRDDLVAFNLTFTRPKFAWGDANRVRHDIVAEPAVFGITHDTDALGAIACTQPDASFNITTDWAIVCSPASPASKPTGFAHQTLFADQPGHWASNAQAALGSYYYCLVKATWPQLSPPPFPPFPPPPKLPYACDAFSQFRPPPFPRP
jgi:GDSL-like Lipase/Acylhydrolase